MPLLRLNGHRAPVSDSAFSVFHSLDLHIDRDLITTLLEEDIVAWVENAPSPNAVLNAASRVLIKADDVANPPRQLTGAGITVGVWDRVRF